MEKKNLKMQPLQGVFWDVNNTLVAFPFMEGEYMEGIAKSQDTYQHEKLWKTLRDKKLATRYNHFPRGRVVIKKQGDAIIYMNPNVSKELLPQIKEAFQLEKDPIIKYDFSKHYRCHLDREWEQDKQESIYCKKNK